MVTGTHMGNSFRGCFIHSYFFTFSLWALKKSEHLLFRVLCSQQNRMYTILAKDDQKTVVLVEALKQAPAPPLPHGPPPPHAPPPSSVPLSCCIDWHWGLQYKNIGGDKILAPTKHWRRQNIGGNINSRVDKNPSLKNSRVDKNLMLTKFSRRQNSRVDKILALTKILRRQNFRVHIVGAGAKESPYCYARQSPQQLTSPGPRWWSPTSPRRCWFPHMQSPSVALPLAALLIWADFLLYHTSLCTDPPCRKRHKFDAVKISASAKISLIFCKL